MWGHFLETFFPGYFVAIENSRHYPISSRHDVWETSVEIPFWRRDYPDLVVFLIGRATSKIFFNQSEALPRPRKWHVITMEFLRSFFSGETSGGGGVRKRVHLKQQRFWVTYVFRKTAFCFFIMSWRPQICMAKCLYSYRDDLPKRFFQNHSSSVQKVHFRLTSVAQKHWT